MLGLHRRRDHFTDWAWVGEAIVWLDVRCNPSVVCEGGIWDCYAFPKYAKKALKTPSDFLRLRVFIEGERGMCPSSLYRRTHSANQRPRFALNRTVPSFSTNQRAALNRRTATLLGRTGSAAP